jgi:hypothetical protein
MVWVEEIFKVGAFNLLYVVFFFPVCLLSTSSGMFIV